MKKSGYSLIPEDWKRIAGKDWVRIQRNLRDEDAEAAGYFLQQSLEKYLKAFLLQNGWKLKKIHTLHDLLNDATTYHSALGAFRKLCERVSGYYFIDRYPPLVPSGLTCEDIETDIEEAKKLIQTLFPTEKLNELK